MSNPEQSAPELSEQTDQVSSDNPTSDTSESYPQLPTKTAKDFDEAILQDCTVHRMRTIARQYEGVSREGVKEVLFRNIFNAMNDDQDCPQCPGGMCDPTVHKFPGSAEPPEGWIKGPNGLYGPPSAPPAPPQPPITRQASTTGLSALPGTSAGQQHQQIPHTSLCPPFQPSSSAGAGNTNPPAVYPAPQLRNASPSRGLFRPTGSLDIRVTEPVTPVVSGVIQPPPHQPNVAQLVQQGGAAFQLAQSQAGAVTNTVTVNGSVHSTGTTQTGQPLDFQAQVDEQLRKEAEELRRKRDQERLLLQQQLHQQQMQNSQQARADYEKLRRQQLAAAQQAEEQAHQLQMQQLRAQMGATALPSPSLSCSPSTQFLAPPAPNQINASTSPPLYSPGFIPTQPNFNMTPPPPQNSPLGTQPQHSPFGSPVFPANQHGAATSFTPAQVQEMVDSRLQAMLHNNVHQHVPSALSLSSNPYALGNPLCGDRGKTKAHKVPNSTMAARLGILAQPIFEVDGNFEDVDMSKLTKILTAGYDNTGPGVVLRQTRWPHRLLQSTVPGYNVVKHKDLTFHQLMNGLISKFLTETPPEKLDPELANKLSFLQFLTEMSFRYSQDEILEVTRETFMAWQNKQFEWVEDWSSINDRLKGYRQRFSQTAQSHTHDRKSVIVPTGKGSGNGGGAGKGGKPQQPQGKTDVNGVPKSFMKANNICINFNNENGCRERASHDNRYGDNKVTLRHICGGCFAKDKTEEPHRVFDCQKNNFSALFRRW